VSNPSAREGVRTQKPGVAPDFSHHVLPDPATPSGRGDCPVVGSQPKGSDDVFTSFDGMTVARIPLIPTRFSLPEGDPDCYSRLRQGRAIRPRGGIG